MSRVRSKNTGIEKLVSAALRARGLKFRQHLSSLPGRPDIVFPHEAVAVFVDGDFWHGYRFPAWKNQLQPFWRQKIENNRRRDKKNFMKLRKMGWRVIRVWGHTIEHDLDGAIIKICDEVTRDRVQRRPPAP